MAALFCVVLVFNVLPESFLNFFRFCPVHFIYFLFFTYLSIFHLFIDFFLFNVVFLPLKFLLICKFIFTFISIIFRLCSVIFFHIIGYISLCCCLFFLIFFLFSASSNNNFTHPPFAFLINTTILTVFNFSVVLFSPT